MKNILKIVCIVISLIVIVVMGVVIYKLLDEKNVAERQIAKLEEDIRIKDNINISEYEEDEDQDSFEELMNKLYIKDGAKENNAIYYNRLNDDVIILEENSSDTNDVVDKLEGAKSTSVEYYENEILLTIQDTKNGKLETNTITGIDEEVVDMKIIPEEVDANARIIVFLTREGNVYYLEGSSIESKSYKAQKVQNLNEVISITKVDCVEDEALEGYAEIIAIKYDGSHEYITKCI